MIVLDTHAWVWWVNDPGMLSRRARKAIDEAMGRKTLHVSSISAWEVALLAQRGRLVLSMDVRDWIARSEALPFLRFVPVGNGIAIESVRLHDFTRNDPADRIIVATAAALGATLVTKDEAIRRYPLIKTLW